MLGLAGRGRGGQRGDAPVWGAQVLKSREHKAAPRSKQAGSLIHSVAACLRLPWGRPRTCAAHDSWSAAQRAHSLLGGRDAMYPVNGSTSRPCTARGGGSWAGFWYTLGRGMAGFSSVAMRRDGCV